MFYEVITQILTLNITIYKYKNKKMQIHKRFYVVFPLV